MSIRLHSQLDSVEKKRSRLEQENEELRVRLQDLEVAKQVLQQEIDKVRCSRSTDLLRLWRVCLCARSCSIPHSNISELSCVCLATVAGKMSLVRVQNKVSICVWSILEVRAKL